MKKIIVILALFACSLVDAQVPAVNSGTTVYPTSGTITAILTGTTGSIGGGALLAGACASGMRICYKLNHKHDRDGHAEHISR